MLLDNQHQQQLPAAYLWTFDHQRTSPAQFGVRFKQELFFLVKFQIQNVTSYALASGIDMQPEEFAGGEPIFLAGFERFSRLADHLELFVAEKVFQRLLDSGQLRWNRLRLLNILRDHETAPNRLRAAQLRRRAQNQRKGDKEQEGAGHERLFGCVIRRQRLQSLSPKHRYQVFLCLKHWDRRIWTHDQINARV